MIYRDYITSQKWLKRKRAYFENHARQCRACGSRKRIHLHHKSYRRLGEERDADLVPLCHICHTALHKKQKSTGQNLWIATDEFIRFKKNRYKSKRLVKKLPAHKRRGPRS